jgi:hypothetical protein
MAQHMCPSGSSSTVVTSAAAPSFTLRLRASEEEEEAVPLPHRSADRCLCRIGRAAFATGALLGGLFIGVVESLSGLYFGDSLGQIGIFLIFILVLLLRPTGLFGARA